MSKSQAVKLAAEEQAQAQAQSNPVEAQAPTAEASTEVVKQTTASRVAAWQALRVSEVAGKPLPFMALKASDPNPHGNFYVVHGLAFFQVGGARIIKSACGLYRPSESFLTPSRIVQAPTAQALDLLLPIYCQHCRLAMGLGLTVKAGSTSTVKASEDQSSKLLALLGLAPTAEQAPAEAPTAAQSNPVEAQAPTAEASQDASQEASSAPVL